MAPDNDQPDKLNTVFSGGNLLRGSGVRRSAEELQAIVSDGTSRFLPVRNGNCLIQEQSPALLEISHIPESQRNTECLTLLGFREGLAVFSVDCPESASLSIPGDSEFLQGRELIGNMSREDAHLLAYARAMNNWQNNHRFCGHCGSLNLLSDAGFLMQCGSDDCDHRSFPRLDPAIIVLVHNGEHCLLGRQQQWPEQRFSTIAGFAEPGESLEDTLAREVKEETNISVGDIQYLGSQPWPFPSALMIGFHAQATSADIALNDDELAEAGWFTREQLRSGEIVLPPRTSIAFQLIAAWHDKGSTVKLADVPPGEAFNAPRA